MSRKYWIDNIRTICILLLFPFHTAMIFNDYEEMWYVNGVASKSASVFVFSVYPWWMSGLFVLAGVSTVYALRKRDIKAYAKERFLKLFVPFVFGLFLVIPVQCYCADRFNNGFTGSFIEFIPRFFRVTDFSGYDGRFTPGNLWFILYLFVISMVCIPILFWYKNRDKKLDGNKIVGWKLILLGVLPPLIEPLGDIGGKSVTEFLGWFLIGYFVLSIDEVQEWVKKYYRIWLVITLMLIVSRAGLYYNDFENDYFGDITNALLRWFGILNLFALGMKLVDQKYSWTEYFAKASYPLYIFHQSFLVVWGYILVNRIHSAMLCYILIVLLSFISTIIFYEIVKRCAITRFMFGMKK